MNGRVGAGMKHADLSGRRACSEPHSFAVPTPHACSEPRVRVPNPVFVFRTPCSCSEPRMRVPNPVFVFRTPNACSEPRVRVPNSDECVFRTACSCSEPRVRVPNRVFVFRAPHACSEPRVCVQYCECVFRTPCSEPRGPNVRVHQFRVSNALSGACSCGSTGGERPREGVGAEAAGAAGERDRAPRH